MPRRILAPARRAAISVIAESVADFFFPDKWIDPESLIREHGLTLSFNHYGDYFDGMLQCKNGSFHVFCNLDRVENSTSDRARFTLAHEFGHYFLDEHRHALLSGRVPSHPSFCNSPHAETVVEREADHFASRLLIPANRVTKVVDLSDPSYEQITALQKAFIISYQSAAIRIVEDSTVPCACVMWRQNGKAWVSVNQWMGELGLTSFKKNLADLPSDCATIQCWNEEPSKEGLNEPKDSVAVSGHWFNGVLPGASNERFLKETCVRLGSYGCLTLVTLHPSFSGGNLRDRNRRISK